MRITILAVVLGLLGCGTPPSTGDIAGALTLEDVPWCDTPHRAVVTSSCGIEHQGVGCFTCSGPVGSPAVAGCAWDETTWCVASCDECPRL